MCKFSYHSVTRYNGSREQQWRHARHAHAEGTERNAEGTPCVALNRHLAGLLPIVLASTTTDAAHGAQKETERHLRKNITCDSDHLHATWFWNIVSCGLRKITVNGVIMRYIFKWHYKMYSHCASLSMLSVCMPRLVPVCLLVTDYNARNQCGM